MPAAATPPPVSTVAAPSAAPSAIAAPEGNSAAAPPPAARPATSTPGAPHDASPGEPPGDAGQEPAWPATVSMAGSAVPYEFPSTGSVRLLPPGRGAATPPGAPSAAGAAPRRPASPARPAAPPATGPRDRAQAVSTPAVTIIPAVSRTSTAAGDDAATDAPPSGGSRPAAGTRSAAGTPAPARAPTTGAPPAAGTAAGSGDPPGSDRAGGGPPAAARRASGDLFGRHTRSYAAENSGQQIAILHAGCTTAEDLGAGALRAAGSLVSVGMIDENSEVTRAAVAQDQSMREAVLGDLRTVPLSPRAYDIVQCSRLLNRIQHAELVLDRLSGAVKPGGLLLLGVWDRDSAAGFLDRVLPGLARRAIWRKRQPGSPGPHVAVYERVSSARGVQAYALMRGLVIAERGARGGLAGGLPPGPIGYLAAQKLVARLSRGRLTAAHEELLYVLRKPEDRFARIL
jgi:SAM-dependent methyltransferase